MLNDRVRSISDSHQAPSHASYPLPHSASAGTLDVQRREALITVLQAALGVEFEAHLGIVDPAHPRRRNSKNGFRTKVLSTDLGPIEITMPRDRQGTFQPIVIRKRQRTFALGRLMLTQLRIDAPTYADAARVVAMVYPNSTPEPLRHAVTGTLLAIATAWERPSDHIDNQDPDFQGITQDRLVV